MDAARAAGWRQSLQELRRTPERYDDERVGWTAARRILRCDDATLERLVEWGLPFRDVEGEPQFGFCDVMNTGLYSGTRRSVPEVAQTYIMRFAADDPASWTQARSWKITVELRCPGGIHCAGPSWRIPLPDAWRFGGSVSPWRTAPAVDLMRAETDAVTRGEIAPVHSPLIRALYDEVLRNFSSGHWRYQYMPRELRLDPDAAAANRTMDCMSTGLWLERRCHGLGLEARTRKGFILGVAGVEHVWIEVREEDGAWRMLDPVLAWLGLRAVGPAGRRFADFSLGSMSNRILSWPYSAREPIFDHACPQRSGTTTLSAAPLGE